MASGHLFTIVWCESELTFVSGETRHAPHDHLISKRPVQHDPLDGDFLSLIISLSVKCHESFVTGPQLELLKI